MCLTRKWPLAGVALLLVLVMTPASASTSGACPPGYVPPRLAEPGAGSAHIPFGNPIAQVGFSYRDIMDRDPDLGRDVDPMFGGTGSTAFSGLLNVAVGFADVTGCDLDRFDRRFVRTVDELLRENVALVRELNLSSSVKALLVVPRFNANKTRRNNKGEVRWIATAIEHSERRVLKSLAQRGVDKARLLAIYTDLAPCSPRGAGCRGRMRATNAAVFHSFASPHRELVPALKEALANMVQADLFATDLDTPADDVAAGRRIPSIFQPRDDAFGAPAAAPAGANSLRQAITAPSGGVDFSKLELRYFADAGTDRPDGLRYGFAAQPAPGAPGTHSASALRATRQTSDAFFVWLALQPGKFTVNLNPTEPDRIMDADLGRTDTGRILLEADFRMKKTVGRLIHPKTKLGRRFWRAIGGRCLAFRQWIVPGTATVHERAGELYILHAPLRLKLENEYLAGKNPGLPLPKGCAGQPARASRQSEQVFRTLIMSRVEKAVNTAPEYAALRRVFLSRVAAEWYRKRSRTASTTFAPMIDSGDINRWTSRRPWQPSDVFNAYVRSYKRGEFKEIRAVGGSRYSYFYGGIDFTTIQYLGVSAAHLERDWSAPPGGPGGRPVLMTGAARSVEHMPPGTVAQLTVAVVAVTSLLVLILAVAAGVLLVRRRRNRYLSRRSAPPKGHR
jgi:hypothetical protein